MDNTLKAIKLIGAGITASITYIFGGVDTVLAILLIFITLDYITGVMAGIATKNYLRKLGLMDFLKRYVFL